MSTSPASSNPYPAARGDPALTPFAGRQKAFEYIYQQLTNHKSAILLGQREMGKTAVLRHFRGYFDDNFIAVYLALKDVTFHTEGDLLLALAEAILNMMIERNMSLSRLVMLQPDAAQMREWFAGAFMDETTKVARSHRLVFLLDDAGLLINAVREGQLSDDYFTFLHDLLTARSHLGIVLALDSRYEADIPLMSPLAEVPSVFRLEPISEDETAWLLREPVKGFYSVNDEAVKAVYRATGGHPRLLQRFGYRLYRLWEGRSGSGALTAEDVKAVTAQVYNLSEFDFERTWSEINRNERLVLMAITQLQYADPLAESDGQAVERWLVESDYPLDMTAVHVALRGLEYEHIITQTPGGIRIAMGLLQTWLLDNGHLNKKPSSLGARRMRWAAIVILLVLLALLALLAQERSGSPNAQDAPPTVTLVATP
jgi:hypothetical protein